MSSEPDNDNDVLYLSEAQVLCVTCYDPIRARITTPQWIRVEWISLDGECQRCVRAAKELKHETTPPLS